MKISLNYTSPINFLFYRFGIASFLLFIFFKKEVILHVNAIVPGVLIGISVSLGNILQVIGLSYTSASHSAFITALYMIFSPIIARFMVKEKIEIINLISLMLAFAGIYLLSNDTPNIPSINFGDFLTIFCAISFAFQVVLIQMYTMKGYDYKALTFWQVLTSFILYAGSAGFTRDFKFSYQSILWIGILYTSLMTAITLAIILKYQKDTTVQRASTLYAGEPMFAYIASFIVLNEVFALYDYLGASLIIISILLLPTRHYLSKRSYS